MPENGKKLVVIGIGNFLQGDEGVGVHAVDELSKENLDPRVEIIDGGAAGFDLLFLLEDADFAIIIDCMEARLEPGTIFRLTAEELFLSAKTDTMRNKLSLHETYLPEVLLAAKELNKLPPTIIFGIQPKEITISCSLSAPVQKALPKLFRAVKKEISELLGCDKHA
ncbi:MAG TPA: Ni,Fe-hydrogenase maturation factor [Desulfotomaculum sp.]|nr:MAG: Ni,Fe-hydrogenase maturation factor [Desulfotomaculum sp. 46_80]KUK85054.1 MAG: Ni,Fe-hydrogenase maturation factor [Desulfofundulus kuznetsovii]HAG10931.1 Ni,Fe-hydrogenase maturation factor [Desulfotomaculum sp.]HBY03962.1 Ni,Fe-hydrogenase maturation factor [Desulfotomaculum sp.]